MGVYLKEGRLKISAFRKFVCPIEGDPLAQENNSLRCDQGHVFDVAREGYCNLLLVQQKATLNPGDNKDMVAARRRFLDGGFFLPIAEHLFKIVRELATKAQNKTLLRIVDAGCGEGYYLCQLSQLAAVSDDPVNLELAGGDISKWAVKAASKRSAAIAWVVAGNRQLPFAAGSVDLILSMFGFPGWESFKTAQSDDGCVVLVEPGLKHLMELRKIIYPQVNVSEPPSLVVATENGYILKREERLKFSIHLENNSAICDLLAMTPHAFRISRKAREDLRALKSLTVSVDVVFLILRKGGRG